MDGKATASEVSVLDPHIGGEALQTRSPVQTQDRIAELERAVADLTLRLTDLEMRVPLGLVLKPDGKVTGHPE